MLSKLGKYAELDYNHAPDDEYFSMCRSEAKSENDIVDDYLLFAVYKDAVHYLVTEDKKIHSKAVALGTSDRIFTVSEFCEFVSERYELRSERLPTVEEVSVRDLNHLDSIFDSLRKDYPGFDDWMRRISREGRRAWVTFSGNKISGICIFDPRNAGCGGNMKLCTFKVSSDYQGEKLGELLLQQAFFFAHHQNRGRIGAIYVEVTSDKDNLLAWFADFGFYKISETRRRDGDCEITLKKDMSSLVKSEDPFQDSIHFFPYCSFPPDVQAFIVPIQPKFAEKLFPDLQEQMQLPGMSLQAACGNAIKKAYICNTPTKNINAGDLLLFYESRTLRAVVCYGVVESVVRSRNPEDILSFIGKRSVYSAQDIAELCGSRNKAVAIKFRYCGKLPRSIRYSTLSSEGVVSGPPISFVNVTDRFKKMESFIPI